MLTIGNFENIMLQTLLKFLNTKKIHDDYSKR